jgi:chemotaxis protein MotB
MRARYLQGAANQRDRWMVSYVDVLTIILIFFLVAAARGLEAPPVHAVVPLPPPVATPAATLPPEAPPSDSPSPDSPSPDPPPSSATSPAVPAGPEQPHTNLLQTRQRLEEQGFAAQLEAHSLVISLPQVALFSAGADTVSPQALPSIARIAQVLCEIPNDVQLVGHADTVPIHNRRFQSNWDLSMARSRRILDLLSNRYGIAESRLSIVSYGPYRPAAPNDTVDGRASNRRVEIVILDEPRVESPNGELVPLRAPQPSNR